MPYHRTAFCLFPGVACDEFMEALSAKTLTHSILRLLNDRLRNPKYFSSVISHTCSPLVSPAFLCRHTSSFYATVGSHPPPTRRHLLVNMHVPGYSYARILVCLHACSALPHAHSLTCTIPCARMPRNPPPTRPLVYAHTHDPISTHARYRSHTNSSFFPPWLSLVTFPFSGSQAPLLPPPPPVVEPFYRFPVCGSSTHH